MDLNRQIKLTSPLGPDVLVIRRMTAEEEMGRLFSFTLDLLSEVSMINHEDLLGKKL
ncbi:MAG: hypothetical protein ABIK28_22190 [Planctomycetota bacterium]